VDKNIIVALDVETKSAAMSLVRRLGDEISWYKVGAALFTACFQR